MARESRIAKSLEVEAARLRRELAALRGGRESGAAWLRPDESGDLADRTAARDRRARSVGRIVELTARLEQVEEALARIDEGTYGTCAQCGGPIHPDRLEVLPYTVLCAADRERLDRLARAQPQTSR